MGIEGSGYPNAMDSECRHVDQSQIYENDIHDGTYIARRSFMTLRASLTSRTQVNLTIGKPDAEYEDQGDHQSLALSQRRTSQQLSTSRRTLGLMAHLLLLFLWIIPTSAVLLRFENCISDSYLNSSPLKLQFVPQYLDAVFQSSDPDHNLNITVWGNVTGGGPETQFVLPPANSSYWTTNRTDAGGKIENLPVDNFFRATTLFNKVNVLTYEPYEATEAFCDALLNRECPVSPVFSTNAYVFRIAAA